VTYRIAGIDVHKRMLAVVIADVSVEGEYQFERRKVGTSPSELCRLAEWLVAEQVEEVVMESTAQYWRPVWAALEQRWASGRRRSQVGPPASGVGAVESRGDWTEEGFPRCGTISKAFGRSGTQTEFRTGCRAAVVADDNEAQASINAESGAVSEPPGVFVRGGAP
jgi:hypothetical protein